jgi:hypothetical protein
MVFVHLHFKDVNSVCAGDLAQDRFMASPKRIRSFFLYLQTRIG